MHEMVAAAMEENLDFCKAHVDCTIDVTAPVIADGVKVRRIPCARCRELAASLVCSTRRALWNKQ